MSELSTPKGREIAHEKPSNEEDFSMMAVIERAARDPNVDVDKMERLFAMQERAQNRNAEMEFNAALSRMQPDLPVIAKDGHGHNRAKFAKLEDIQKAIAPVLAQHGFAITFKTETANDVVVTAILSHRGGHSSNSTITLPKDTSGSKNAVQAIGSSVAYGQRYALKSLLNLSISDVLDDDGQGGGGKIITAAQVKELRMRIDDLKVVIPTFLNAYVAGSLDNFPASQYQKALDDLNRKKQKRINEAAANG